MRNRVRNHPGSFVWFAAGVVVAVITTMTFTAWRAVAVTGGESTFVPITPCRLLDTRPASQVGPKSSPVGPGEDYSLQVTGTQGECNIPDAATAVAVNLTGVGATAPTFVAIYPADAANPGTSALNMLPGQSPTPNKIDVKLSPDGEVKLFNKFGSMHIVGDVLGYYRNDGLADLEARLVALETAQPFAVSDFDPFEEVTVADEVVVSVEVTAPVAGHVTVNSSTLVSEDSANNYVRCSITTGSVLDNDSLQWWESAGTTGDTAQLAGTRRFEIAAKQTAQYHLVCDYSAAGFAELSATWLTGIFTPAP